MSGPVLRWMHPRLDDEFRSAALAVISPSERHRYTTIPAARRDYFLTGRWMLRQLASELTGVAPEVVPLRATCPDCGGEHGKPEIAGSDLHVSLSYGDGIVVAAAVWGAAVGVDIGSPTPPVAALSAIGVLTGERSLLRWTRLEAVLKADGRGLRVDPSQVIFTTVTGASAGEAPWLEGSVIGSPARYRVSDVQLADDVRVSVALRI